MGEVYVAEMWDAGDDDSLIIGVFSTLEAAQAACGVSANEWSGPEDDSWGREDEWGPHDPATETEWQQRFTAGRELRAMLRGQSAVTRYVLDEPRWNPIGSTNAWGGNPTRWRRSDA